MSKQLEHECTAHSVRKSTEKVQFFEKIFEDSPNIGNINATSRMIIMQNSQNIIFTNSLFDNNHAC